MLSRISLLAAALLLAGCESGSQSTQAPEQTGLQPADTAATPVSPDRPVETLQSEPAGKTVPEGELEIGISDTGVAITANAVSQQTILYHLAMQAGFEITEAGVPWEVVTLAIETGNLHAALVALLKQHPYQIIYEFDTDRQADTLARVVVGEPLAAQEWLQPAPDTGITPDIPYRSMLPGATEAALSAEDQAYLTQLLDPSAEVREDAAGNIEPVGIALDYLTETIRTDPSPDVRIAAASTLEDSEDPRALEALIMALQDENSAVLETVIDALVYLENRSAVPYLMPFLDHPDEDVRDSAENAMDQFD
jgi:hypothetical protein